MKTIVMEVKEASRHPNADSLWLYKMGAAGFNDVQIVANSTNIYSVGAKAIVVLSGATLKDGTKIRESQLRGVTSYGMALGHTEHPVGTDLTEEYCRDTSTDGFHFISWPSIESLFNVKRSMHKTNTARSVAYASKIKLDGTNAGVQISMSGRVAAQSRTKIITPEDDNMGFAQWVDNNFDYFKSLASDKHITVFGEWCGTGIQKGTAISDIGRKIFAVFAIQYGGINGEPAQLDINPRTIQQLLVDAPQDIFVLPWLDSSFIIDYTDQEQMQQQVNRLNMRISNIEQCDPWVKGTFGIEGIGEGLVAYPLPSCGTELFSSEPIFVDAMEYSELVFKAKGEKHKVVKTKESVQIDPEIVKNIGEFIDLFATETRLNQISTGLDFDPKNTGTFIKNFTQDVFKESEAELEASGLTWKQVAKDVSTAARKWFLAKCDKL